MTECDVATVTVPSEANRHGDLSDCMIIHKICALKDLPAWSDESFCIEAVTENCAIAYPLVRNKTNLVKQAALKNMPKLIGELPAMLHEQAVRKNPATLGLLKDQTDALCRLAISIDPYAIQHVRDQTESMCLWAVQIKGSALQFVRNKTRVVCETAVNQDPWAIKHVPAEQQTDDLCMCALRRSQRKWQLLKYLQNPSARIKAVMEFPNLLGNIENPTDAMIRHGLKACPWKVADLKSPTEADYTVALKANGHVIRVISAKTPALCELAVQTSPPAIEDVPASMQTEAMCIGAVQSDGLLLRHVTRQTAEICLAAVEKTPSALELVKDQTVTICTAAMERDYESFRHIRVKTPELFAIFKAERWRQRQ